ncbi:hypothetical protein A6R68_21605 [Neotoma lepida]|uniref:Mitochondrial inner membrane protein COX18 n=1 Tax=Neotoma lepida TaxID=56216 RepID=A0A1A6HR42_NEOLE|nr:hypothetical protein A6R68_21605 [Neotoma lepida]
MLCCPGPGWLRTLPTLRLRARGLQPGWSNSRLPALPVWAAASVSAAAPGGWYEALAASAPVRAAEEVLLGSQAATGLPWWGSILLSTVALRGAVTLPLAAYQHYILAKIFALQKLGMSRFQMYVTHFVRAISVLMIPIAATVPSSLVLYWLCSSVMGLSQNLLLRSPGFRRLCRIPPTKSDSETPYKDLSAAFCAKFLSRK